MKEYFKAVRLDGTSHYDKKTKWEVGKAIEAPRPDPKKEEPCGRGVHCSPTLLDAVGYQPVSSRYFIVRPHKIIAQDTTKARCDAVTVVRELPAEEQDAIAGFKLYEANHPVNPLLITPQDVDYKSLLASWIRVRDSVWSSVGGYTGGLFPNVTKWTYAEGLGPDPWRPLLTLWYAGYLPSFDGKTWRLHAGKDAKVVYKQ